VQSSFPEERQGEISGLSRSVSNLGTSFGTAIAGTILVSDLASGNGTYVIAMVVLAALALVGLAAAVFLPANPEQRGAIDDSHRAGCARYGYRARVRHAREPLARAYSLQASAAAGRRLAPHSQADVALAPAAVQRSADLGPQRDVGLRRGRARMAHHNGCTARPHQLHDAGGGHDRLTHAVGRAG
jgi:hypothetical protein